MTPTPTSAQLAQTGKASPEPDVMAPVFPETNQRQTDARIDLKLFEPKTMCPTIAVRDREER